MSSLVGEREKLSIKYILNGDDSDIWEALGQNEMVKSVVDTVNSSDNTVGEGSDVEDGQGDLMLDISFVEKIKAIRAVLRISEIEGEIEMELQRRLRLLIRSQRRTRSTGLRESNLDSFFRK